MQRTEGAAGDNPRPGKQVQPMVTMRIVLDLINARKNWALLLAQAALPEHQFKAFRTLLLDEFGQKGLEAELARVFAEDRQHGVDRNGQE